MNIKWNKNVKLVLSDVDETIADVYTPAAPEMIKQLERLLEGGVFLFLVTGAGLKRVRDGITSKIDSKLRQNILISHCSGAEVWGFKEDGNIKNNPYYTVYDELMNDSQKKKWREIIEKVIKEFKLKTYDSMPVKSFKEKHGDDPLSIMMEDRGPQITFEMVNAYDMHPDEIEKLQVEVPQTHGVYDLRIPVLERADELLREEDLPVVPKLGGVFALDFALKGISKETSITSVLKDENLLNDLGIDANIKSKSNKMEIWGDKFSEIRGGSDRHMCEAVDLKVRAIDFRDEDPEEFPKGYNIVLWNGEKRLHEGLLEYLTSKE